MADSPQTTHRTDPSSQGPERVRCIHWNCGGLSEELKLEWETWLRQQADIKIYALVETHWSFSNVYISGDWHITHSAEPGAKRCGVMVGVRKDCVELDSIKWRELIPGRLLHWRGAIGKQQFDIAAVCQTALGLSAVASRWY